MKLQKRGGIHPAFAMYRSKYAVFLSKVLFKNCQKTSVYAALSDFCVIITQASTRLKVPVALIHLSPFTIHLAGG